MSDIFLSYAREDVGAARAIARLLERRGWSVWWDREIPAGKSFDDVIELALDAAQCVVVLWSSHAIRSDWVKAEASEGRSRNILVPLLIEDVTPPLQFRRLQAVRIDPMRLDPESEQAQVLLQSISQVVAPRRGLESRDLEPRKDERSPTQRPPTGWRWAGRLWAVAALALLAAVAAIAPGLRLLGSNRDELTFRGASLLRPEPGSVSENREWSAADRESLANLKIDVYFDEEYPPDRKLAEAAAKLIGAAVPNARVVLAPRTASFHDRIIPQARYAVRFDPPQELQSAESLVRLLNYRNPRTPFVAEPVATGTQDVLSILIFSRTIPVTPAS